MERVPRVDLAGMTAEQREFYDKYATGVRAYYHDSRGANITQWPSSHLKYLVTVRAMGLRGLRPARFAATRVRPVSRSSPR